MKPFDTDKMPWLFTPHGDGELNEYFSTDHSKIIAETSKEVLASLSESRDRLSGKLCYEFHYNQRRYKYTLLRFADMIVRGPSRFRIRSGTSNRPGVRHTMTRHSRYPRCIVV